MWLFFAFGGLCRLRKHGSNCPRLAGELKYFCNSSVIYEFAGHRACDPARVNDHGLSYFEDYLLGTTYECGSVSIDQASIVTFAKEFDPQPFHVDPEAAAAGPYGGLIASGWPTPALAEGQPARNHPRPQPTPRRARHTEPPLPHPARPGAAPRVPRTGGRAPRA